MPDINISIRVPKDQYDVLIVGGGGSAMTAAAFASELGAKVLLVSKDPIGGGDTKISEGGITVRKSGSTSDSVETLFHNIRTKGNDLSDEKIVRAFSSDCRRAYEWLRKNGLRPYVRPDGKGVKVFPMPLGGHNRLRSVPHTQGGLSFTHTLLRSYLEGRYSAIQDAWFLDLILNQEGQGRKVEGGLIYHAPSGELMAIKAHSVVLATGGIGTLFFPNTDNMKGNTGDGHASALRAGVGLVDMEQVQFIPFALARPKALKGLFIGESSLGGLFGVLQDRDSKVILTDLMYRVRSEITSVMAQVIAHGRGTDRGGCLLDLRENVRGQSGRLWYQMLQSNIGRQLDLVRRTMGEPAARLQEPWEVQPSAHYCMGGIAVNRWGECTGKGSIQGLFAAGEVMGGLHGSDRLAGNALAEIIVFGIRAGVSAVKHSIRSKSIPDGPFSVISGEVAKHYIDAFGREGGEHPILLQRELQKAVWQGTGPARTAKGIRQVLSTIANLRERVLETKVNAGTLWNQEFIDLVELENMLITAESIAHSALLREGSLGAHVRLDSKKGTNKNRSGRSVFVRFTKGTWQSTLLLRERTPLRIKIKDRVLTVIRKTMTDFLIALPFPIRDRLLAATFKKMMQ
ncbi:FAD-binding protein [Thermodesulfobacteriota bacterium]